jgi:hypothetical protein
MDYYIPRGGAFASKKTILWTVLTSKCDDGMKVSDCIYCIVILQWVRTLAAAECTYHCVTVP